MLMHKRNWILKSRLNASPLSLFQASLQFLFLILILSSCSARPSGARANGRIINFTNCQMPPDQGYGSLVGHWGGLPVPVVFDNDYYMTDSGEAMPSLRNALATWNGWASLRGYRGFSISNDGTGLTAGREIPPSLAETCDQRNYTAQVTDVVGVWKIGSAGNHKNQRVNCKVTETGAPGRILPTGVQGQTDWITSGGLITGASILLNFEEFNAPGKAKLDVESLLLHELGHVLGMLHSCNGTSGDSYDGTTAPACGNPNISPFYLDAVMFPFLDARQLRRKLTQNEYDRINCLY